MEIQENTPNTMPTEKRRKTSKSTALSICEVAIFTTLLIAAGFIKIPMPPIPFTLQTMICLIGGGLIGKWKSMASVLLYIFLGLVGLPIFTAGGGFYYVLYPTFGYLLAMIAGSFFAGFFAKKKLSLVLLIIIYSIITLAMLFLGTIYMYMILNVNTYGSISFGKAMYSGFALFILPDIIKSTLAAIIVYKVKPILKKIYI